MAANVTKRLWEMSDIVDVLEAYEAKAANLGELDRDRKALDRIALRAFKRAEVETPNSRFDAGQPHRLATLGTGQNSDFSATK